MKNLEIMIDSQHEKAAQRFKIRAQHCNESTRQFIKIWFPKNYNFSVSGVLYLCPYSLEELRQKNKSQTRVYWRNLLMICHFMNGKSISDSASELNRHHSTLLHAINQMYISRELKSKGINSEFNNVIELVLNTPTCNIVQERDICLNEAVSIAYSENQFFNKYPHLYEQKPTTKV